MVVGHGVIPTDFLCEINKRNMRVLTEPNECEEMQKSSEESSGSLLIEDSVRVMMNASVSSEEKDVVTKKSWDQ